MHNVKGTVIYIGKSKNIKKRLNQHFTNDNRKSKKIQEEIHALTYEETGSELIALLKENEEIKKNNPFFNRALRRVKYKIKLIHYTDEKGYIHLKTEKAQVEQRPITTFSNMMSAKSHLDKAIDNYSLCQHKVLQHTAKGNCFNYTIKKCNGACIETEAPDTYNKRVLQFIKRHSYENKSVLLIDRGRDVDERSVVLIEDGSFKGIAFFNLNFQITNVEVLKSIITPMDDNRDAQHIIQSYIRTHKILKTIPLSEITS